MLSEATKTKSFLRSLLIMIGLNLIYAIPKVPSPYDENGCCISCGYSYCPTLLECIRVWETECPTGASETAKIINPFLPIIN